MFHPFIIVVMFLGVLLMFLFNKLYLGGKQMNKEFANPVIVFTSDDIPDYILEMENSDVFHFEELDDNLDEKLPFYIRMFLDTITEPLPIEQ